jgi:hypothetical protein
MTRLCLVCSWTFLLSSILLTLLRSWVLVGVVAQYYNKWLSILESPIFYDEDCFPLFYTRL